MANFERMLAMLNQIGHEVLNIFWLPSIEALVLGKHQCGRPENNHDGIYECMFWPPPLGGLFPGG